MEEFNCILLLHRAVIKMKEENIRKTGIIALVLIIAALSAFFAINKPEITGHATVGTELFVSARAFDYNCSLTLLSGWNLISIPCRIEDMGMDSVLQGISGDYESIHTYSATDSEDPWKSYKEGLPSWVDQDLDEIDTMEGYWIKMITPETLQVNGTIILPTGSNLQPGWNLVGYATNTSKPPQDAFMEINTSVASVHAYNASDTADYWKVWAPSLGPPFNDLVLMVSYWGYWVNATAEATWLIYE
jgi:hypothetical protein